MRTEFSNQELRVFLVGEIDHWSIKGLIHAITQQINYCNPVKCVLDFQSVDFMDESRIAMIINILRSMVRNEGTLVLTNLNNQPMRVLRAAGVDKLVSIE